MSALRIGIDVDGVLADFNTPYIDLIEKHSGVRLPAPSDTYPDRWNYEADAGMEKSRTSKMWEEIKASPTFWLDIPPYTDTERFLSNLSFLEFDTTAEVYFITNRMGVGVKSQTEDWLRKHGYEYATVLISQYKGLCANALKLDLYLDDKIENCTDARDASPNTQVYMYKRPWNTIQENIPTISNLKEFTEEIARRLSL